jgi:hypothetical protein
MRVLIARSTGQSKNVWERIREQITKRPELLNTKQAQDAVLDGTGESSEQGREAGFASRGVVQRSVLMKWSVEVKASKCREEGSQSVGKASAFSQERLMQFTAETICRGRKGCPQFCEDAPEAR